MAFWSSCKLLLLLFADVCANAVRDQHKIKDFLRLHQLEKEQRFAETPVYTHCPNGYVRHDDSCYVLAHATVTWPDALVYCEAYGGHLAYIESEREQHFLEGL
ncbi:C-type lectin domain family 10 member A-like [Mercenaria mercenaria]|uniref:C-type lectin domain family 10 member A-like n=1 Tax=Mercenaria mercenaria TaxID=6596 RepID=UPI00234EB1C6|nr:C-type lectin domain family 10 member A-like [Mercenaria mercenaria]